MMTGSGQTQFQFAPACLDWLPAYCLARREGFRRGIEKVAAAAEVDAIEADPAGWLTERTRQTGNFTMLDGREVPRVPFTLLWLMLGDRFIGELSLRHRIEGDWGRTAGHIGYGIHPHWQGQGWGKTILGLGLQYARDLGLEHLCVTAASSNIASWKVIEANGGEFMEEIVSLDMHGGETIRRYWIDL